MYRRLISGIFAAFVALAPPLVGKAASPDEAENASAIAVQRADTVHPAISDQAAMVLVGGALIGIGAALRRAA